MPAKVSVRSINAVLSRILDFKPSHDSHADALEKLKAYLKALDEHLIKEFNRGQNIRLLVRDRARLIDRMLVELWRYLEIPEEFALIAVGGYGRGELHPHSDIDLLVLTDSGYSKKAEQSISSFITLIWDCHLKVGHAVRNLKECVSLAKEDVTIATNLMESRHIIGKRALFEEMRRQTGPDKIWNKRDFFNAKVAEQKVRYLKFDSSSFNLEPNIKSSPGGLRDIHLIGWIAQRAYYPKSLNQLIKQNVITKKEYYSLTKCQLFMWQVRFALHVVSGKAEDRLLFDYQKKTAKMMGYKDSKESLAVEKMMKQYYRCVLVIRNISDILMQALEEQVSPKRDNPDIIDINEHFHIVNEHIDAKDRKLFLRNPSQLLKIFQYIARDESIRGIGASTLRAIRAARYKITASFRNNKNNKELFVEFWHILHTSSRAMFLMKRSGILADYLEAFKQITGQMQYDMFHNYTVDEHTLFLLRNLSDFAATDKGDEFPLCSEIMRRQKNPELIFLAGLFHDIAKGRGGDHSELGAIEVKSFCRRHKIDPEHALIIEWLVANHLIMSLTAQKRDISDPRVIKDFAESVGNTQRLELLYILTVADIRATSSSLWNSWKDSLLKELFKRTKEYLANEKEDLSNYWKKNKDRALEILKTQNVTEIQATEIWKNVDNAYFAKRSPRAIAWHTTQISQANTDEKIVIGIKSMPHRSGTELFIYTLDQANLFALLTATLSRQNLRVQAANIYTDKSGYCYDSFFVLDSFGKALKGTAIKRQIKEAVKYAIENELDEIDEIDLSVQRKMPRQMKYFSIKTKVEFFEDKYTGYTRLDITARDYPGLLATIGKAFKLTGVRLHDARIATLGEKVEDTFVISNRDNSPINDFESQEKIRKQLVELIEN